MSLSDEARIFTIKQRMKALEGLRKYLPNSPDDDRRRREIDLLQEELLNIAEKK